MSIGSIVSAIPGSGDINNIRNQAQQLQGQLQGQMQGPLREQLQGQLREQLGGMNIQGALQGLQRPGRPEEAPVGRIEGARAAGQPIRIDTTRGSFGQMLQRAIGSVDNSMRQAEAGAQDFIAGKTDNVHDVMINMQRAQLSFQMMVEVRNKAIETYQELSRMQI